MPIPTPRYRVVDGEVQTTDHRSDGSWIPVACPLSHHDTVHNSISPHHCYVDGGCPFLELYEKAGKVYCKWMCAYQTVEHEIESVTWS